MAVAEYMEYAEERARWWSAKHPSLRDDIMATAMLALVQAFNRRIPQYPKAFLSKCIENAVIDLLEANYLIRIPRSEIARRKAQKETLDTLPRAVVIGDEELWDLRKDREFPTWMRMQAEDVGILLELTEREQRILKLRMQGYTNAEVGLEFGISEAAVRKAIGLVKGRYLTLIHNHRGILKPNE
jgi:RNA polymerase sigma factor (sigma-70 family)